MGYFSRLGLKRFAIISPVGKKLLTIIDSSRILLPERDASKGKRLLILESSVIFGRITFAMERRRLE